MGNKKVMIIGSGAREHAIALKYAQGESVSDIMITPGNQGMLRGIDDATKVGMDLSVGIEPSTSLKDPLGFLRVAIEYKPDLIDVAQDDALAAGTVDILRKSGFTVFGPTKKAARIEWDKQWAREFMRRHDLPIPSFNAFLYGDENAISYAHSLLDSGSNVFFKASGLYAGKGVIQVTEHEKVTEAFNEIQKMGSASQIFLVETGLVGEEFSYYAIVNGRNFRSFNSAQDNKKQLNGDNGPNTGGMGSNSPALVTKGLEGKIEDTIIAPTVEGLFEEGITYTGVLYLGGMMDKDGKPWIIEFNSRWGDPECQVVLPGIKGDYYELVTNSLINVFPKKIENDGLTRVCIVGASSGYPREYKKGKRIFVDGSKMPKGTYLLSAGIKMQNGEMITDGGRVFNIIAEEKDVIEARRNALMGMACCNIEGNGLQYRTDIAWRDVERVQQQRIKESKW